MQNYNEQTRKKIKIFKENYNLLDNFEAQKERYGCSSNPQNVRSPNKYMTDLIKTLNPNQNYQYISETHQRNRFPK